MRSSIAAIAFALSAAIAACTFDAPQGDRRAEARAEDAGAIADAEAMIADAEAPQDADEIAQDAETTDAVPTPIDSGVPPDTGVPPDAGVPPDPCIQDLAPGRRVF